MALVSPQVNEPRTFAAAGKAGADGVWQGATYISAVAAAVGVQIYIMKPEFFSETDFFPEREHPMRGQLHLPPEQSQGA